MFKRDGRYYLLAGRDCCACTGGSKVVGADGQLQHFVHQDAVALSLLEEEVLDRLAARVAIHRGARKPNAVQRPAEMCGCCETRG